MFIDLCLFTLACLIVVDKALQYYKKYVESHNYGRYLNRYGEDERNYAMDRLSDLTFENNFEVIVPLHETYKELGAELFNDFMKVVYYGMFSWKLNDREYVIHDRDAKGRTIFYYINECNVLTRDQKNRMKDAVVESFKSALGDNLKPYTRLMNDNKKLAKKNKKLNKDLKNALALSNSPFQYLTNNPFYYLQNVSERVTKKRKFETDEM